MFRCVTDIRIEQVGRVKNKILSFDFVNEFDATDTWVDLTNQANIKFPKNIYTRDENGKLFPLGGTNKNAGGFSNDEPLFLRGDKISINFGYRYYDKNGNEFLDMPAKPIFDGYITEIQSKMPIELKCEDNMWKLKQITAPNKNYSASITWEAMLVDMLTGTGFTVNALTKTHIGDLRIMNETVAQVLARVRKDYRMESYFRGTELRSGGKVYIDTEAVDHTFVFQQNIITDDLMYKRKDDLVLSAICYVVTSKLVDGTTNAGSTKTKKERLEILIYYDKNLKEFTYMEKKKGVEYPPNVEGERDSYPYYGITNAADLFKAGVEDLKKHFYTGFKGKFTTFAIPYVKQGDNVYLRDNILPERNGKYKVKGVQYSGGVGGHRQEIILDYKID